MGERPAPRNRGDFNRAGTASDPGLRRLASTGLPLPRRGKTAWRESGPFSRCSACSDDGAAEGALCRDPRSVLEFHFVNNVPKRFVPPMEELKAQGKIGHGGITGTGVPRAIIDAAVSNCIGVMGIRAVQAGALTNAIDRTLAPNHAEVRDFERAASYRALCREIGQEPVVIAHRYALSMAGVDTVILGVKNRAELKQCLDAEAAGPVEPALMTRIDGLGLRDA